MCVSINGPGDLDLCPFDLETGMPVASKVGNLPSDWTNLDTLGIGYSNYSLCTRRTDGLTDGRTKATLISPFATGGA